MLNSITDSTFTVCCGESKSLLKARIFKVQGRTYHNTLNLVNNYYHIKVNILMIKYSYSPVLGLMFPRKLDFIKYFSCGVFREMLLEFFLSLYSSVLLVTHIDLMTRNKNLMT